METTATALIGPELLFVLGHPTDQVGRRTGLARVTLLSGCGLIVGMTAGAIVVNPARHDNWAAIMLT